MRNHPITFHIRFTEKEYERLCKYAAKAGLPKTTYIRHMINGNQPKEAPSVDYFAMVQEIYAVGNNLNQLTARAHYLGWVESDQLQAAREDLTNLIRQITHRMILPEKMDVKEVLKRGKQVAEQDGVGG